MYSLRQSTTPPTRILTTLSASLLRTIAYFDVFDFPLTAMEVYDYCDQKVTRLQEVKSELDGLVDRGVIHSYQGYYYIGSTAKVFKRELSGRNLEHYLAKAYSYSKIIARFPFVRGISISGSLSKGCAGKGADVDYFIITAPGRLWLCRTLLTLFKKLVLLNSRKYFCINYFVDTEHLEIPDRNVFTATEIATLIPTYNYKYYQQFIDANGWVSRHYPRRKPIEQDKINEKSGMILKRVAESILGGYIGPYLEKACMNFTKEYRRRKFSHLTEEEFNKRMRSTEGVAKHHPESFQDKVLATYRRKIELLESRFGIRLT